jgi:hypothetical protein
MRRLGLSSSVLALSVLALTACASPETEIGATAATRSAAPAAALVEAPAVEASISPLAPETPVLTQVADAEDALTMPVSYSCDGDRRFVATFPEHGNAVTVAAAGEVRVLAHKGASDQLMFADASGVTLSAEGADATLTGLGEAYVGCMAG